MEIHILEHQVNYRKHAVITIIGILSARVLREESKNTAKMVNLYDTCMGFLSYMAITLAGFTCL